MTKVHSDPQLAEVLCESSATGLIRSMQSDELVSSVVRHVKGSERHLHQRINYWMSNAGTNNDSSAEVGWQMTNVIVGAEWL